jgi:hypothetical protein
MACSGLSLLTGGSTPKTIIPQIGCFRGSRLLGEWTGRLSIVSLRITFHLSTNLQE